MDLPNLKIIGLCLLISGEARCGDKSDQKFCLDSVFTGCFTNTSLGLRIVDCASCFCQLGDSAGQVRLTARNTDLTSHLTPGGPERRTGVYLRPSSRLQDISRGQNLYGKVN